MHTLQFKKSASDDLKGLPEEIQVQITARLRTLSSGDPEKSLNIKPLKGAPGYFRLRSGACRVIFYQDGGDSGDSKTLIVGVKHLRDAYA